MPPLFRTATEWHTLMSAWDKVEENAGSPGVDGVSVDAFGFHLDEELAQLQRALRSHSYTPQPVLRIWIDKPQGGQRPLAIPTVRDRVAQTAVARVISPILDAEFEDVSFGYRPGRSVNQALARVRTYRDQGYQWVVDADLDAFFDNVDHALLLSRLEESIADPDILALVRLWLTSDIHDRGNTVTPALGIQQGSPLSPILANLYLDRFDEEMGRRGYKLIRFADDFLILCKEKPKAEKALQVTQTLLADLRLTLDSEKTRITHFDYGFRYLGTMFLRTLDMPRPRRQKNARGTQKTETDTTRETVMARALKKACLQTAVGDSAVSVAPVSPKPLTSPPEDQLKDVPETPEHQDLMDDASPEARRVHVPFRRTLYIQEQGSVLARDDERLIVKKEGNILLDVPTAKIDQIFIFGNCTITTPAMTFCLKEDIPIVLFSSRGNYYGIIDSPLGDNVSLHKQQFARASDPAFCVATAKAVVAGKMHNGRLLLQRHQRRKQIPAVAQAIARIGEARVRLDQASTVEEVNGYEGTAAAQYFAALGKLVDPAFGFSRRTRRPPTDPVNSLLSFGYTLLFYNMYALIVARGLHPYVGHLHVMRDRHPALASDLLEEFRAPIVDSLVLYLINGKLLTKADFVKTRGGPCLLQNEGRKTFIKFFEQKMATQVTHPQTGYVVDYRRCLDLQVCEMVQWIRGQVNTYTPMRMK